MFHFIKGVLERMVWRKPQKQEQVDFAQQEEGNPYLPQLREIMGQILERKGISYGQFVPVLIDGGDSKDALLAAELLGRDVNRLVILTDHPEYFAAYADSMYEEQGLIAEIFPKELLRLEEFVCSENSGIVILDFEEKGTEAFVKRFGKKIYIPIFKRRWEADGNLDIAVPIGYNTMTVRGSAGKAMHPRLDKFEKAFYENE